MKLPALVLCGLFLQPLPTLAQTITIGVPDVYDVGDYTVDGATFQGFDKALGDALCARGGLTCAWTAMPHDTLFDALRAKEIDVVMAAIPVNADLGDGIETTAPYLYPDPFTFAGLPAIRQVFGSVKSVAALRDPAIEAWKKTTGYNITYHPTLQEAVKAVEAGSADVVVAETEKLLPMLAAYDGPVVAIRGGRPRPGVTMALHADNIDLRFTFEDLIYDMSQDSSLNALTEKWFGIDATPW
ncbi:transporter substrate-binding domain-containing protein [Marimonas lutisalis]|uniref:transporter substrate-binding domain-containing protein n=1 Tax=Marimonas lutisalis TaxID=2545756 RepID=UPI00137590C7|nr:transporter substrate-binding domain-containing protein [Marimonas lutisalis]